MHDHLQTNSLRIMSHIPVLKEVLDGMNVSNKEDEVLKIIDAMCGDFKFVPHRNSLLSSQFISKDKMHFGPCDWYSNVVNIEPSFEKNEINETKLKLYVNWKWSDILFRLKIEDKSKDLEIMHYWNPTNGFTHFYHSIYHGPRRLICYATKTLKAFRHAIITVQYNKSENTIEYRWGGKYVYFKKLECFPKNSYNVDFDLTDYNPTITFSIDLGKDSECQLLWY